MMTEIVPLSVIQRLAQRSPVAVLIPEDISAAKQSFDIHESRIKIGTIHSAKGLDFEVGYLIDATCNPVSSSSKSVPVDDAARKHRNLLFVGAQEQGRDW